MSMYDNSPYSQTKKEGMSHKCTMSEGYLAGRTMSKFMPSFLV